MFYQETRTAKAATIGTIMPWTGGLTSVPKGWVICDGQALKASDYPLLAQTIGDSYNAGLTDFGGNFPNYNGSIKLPNLNGKTLIDIEPEYFANEAAGGTGRAADLDPDALALLSPLIGTNEDSGVTTIFTDVQIDLIFNINSDDRTGFIGKIAGNTLEQGEGARTVYLGPRKLGRKHVKRHNHPGSYETIETANSIYPGQGVVPWGTVSYTLFFQATDNVGSNENAGDTFYFGWSEDVSYREDGGGIYGTTNVRPGLLLGTGWIEPQAGQDLQATKWVELSGFNQGSPGTVIGKVAAEAPPYNLIAQYCGKTPISVNFITTPAKPNGPFIADSVPYGIGGNTVAIPSGYRNFYNPSDTSGIRETLMSHAGYNFTTGLDSPDDYIQPHTHDDFEVVFDGSRMRPQSSITADVNLPVSTTLDNVANRNALQIDFNISQPSLTCIYIIRAY
jgi:hypothetical protein